MQQRADKGMRASVPTPRVSGSDTSDTTIRRSKRPPRPRLSRAHDAFVTLPIEDRAAARELLIGALSVSVDDEIWDLAVAQVVDFLGEADERAS